MSSSALPRLAARPTSCQVIGVETVGRSLARKE
jgi:hypothetical protein